MRGRPRLGLRLGAVWLALHSLACAPAIAGPDATAPLTLPHYADEVVVAAWYDIDQRLQDACLWPGGNADAGFPPLRCDPERIDAAIAFAQRFQTVVRQDARLHYLIGLGHRYVDRTDLAKTAIQKALQLDPSRVEAWMELGELHLSTGSPKEALAAFTQVTDRLPEGPGAWFGWLARAQAHATLGQPDPFESSLREALKHGFSFRIIEGQPAWQGFFADPVLRPVIERMVTVYGDPAVLEALDPGHDKAPPPAPANP